MKDLGIAAAAGIVLGIAVVWWVRPDTSAGAVFLIVAITMVSFLAGALLKVAGKMFRRT